MSNAHSAAVVLTVVLEHGPLTTTDILKKVNYARSTVEAIISTLVLEGVVEKRKIGKFFNYSVPQSMQEAAKRRIAKANPPTKHVKQ